jgi:hypothetical protein
MKSPAQLAREILGDGKLPNKYFLSLSNDYLYYDGESSNWIGDLIKNFRSKGGTIAVFDTYAEAKEAADGYSLGNIMTELGMSFTVNRVTIEDRLSGELYEHTKTFFPAAGKIIDEEEHEDLRFTQKKLGRNFR